MRIIGFFFMLLGLLATVGELNGIAFPTVRWFFETSREIPWLNVYLPWAGFQFLWFGWLSAMILLLGGLIIVIRSWTAGPLSPSNARRLRRFCEIKRGYYSLIILLALLGIAGLDQMIVGKRALAVKYHGEWYFPAFQEKTYKNKDFGLVGEDADAPANYRLLKRKLKGSADGKVIMPLIPFDPTGDTLPPRSKSLVEREGVYYESGRSSEPYWGLAASYYDVEGSKMHVRYTMRRGVLEGAADGWDSENNPVYTANYEAGKLVTEEYTGTASKEEFLAEKSSDLRAVKYHPSPPVIESGNWLGTTSQGYDVVAYLYGGLQVNFKAAIIFLPIVYLIGIIIGMLMGFFGGWFDLVVQRIMEIFVNVPFLFVVIIISSMVPYRFKGLPVILGILIFFGWMGITALMRTATFRDRGRDYISAARVMGAGTPRILFRHLLPNTVAIIVTLVPFSLSSLISSLASLDYLGFGLPPEYATWGRLLSDGLSNLSAPWLVTSTFIALVGLLVLITFIGEAIREAFDPKKFTYYR
ncbi:ABC transporter permease subunit [Luteolibacter pohnpeiensis]|uniref:ABC transporter permease subunit n=1 Tax=Luteolibacter pohnpeiensis TaxID=454153 RepID=A0A934VR83_9BACT|nr:ABC transporter permease subunit [Luteolibacter pohnpeiensis]MBK1882921.1 ABC transporter permease subunit [Luteolibacter pohnpeiensis]